MGDVAADGRGAADGRRAAGLGGHGEWVGSDGDGAAAAGGDGRGTRDGRGARRGWEGTTRLLYLG